MRRAPDVFAWTLFLLALCYVVARGQETAPQPDLDLPVRPESYLPGAPAAPVRGGGKDDPRDQPPPVFYGEEIEAESDSIVYVLDFSDSMNYAERLDLAKHELRRSLDGLPESFRFAIVLYGCGVALWAPELRVATEANKRAAWEWVRGRATMGGTGTGPGVAQGLALDRTCTSVVLLTDGDPNCGALDPTAAGHRKMIHHANTQGAAINVFGIDAYADCRAFCQDVAADSGGSYFDIPGGGGGKTR